MAIRNSYTMMIERLCFEVIPDFKPPVQVKITGRYAVGDTQTEVVVKVPTNPIQFTIKMEMKS